MMTVSLCMGTYNGEKYIEEQLCSILNQTRKPDEVIICDDGSQDHTVEIIFNFIEKNQLQDKWHLYVNKRNKGYPANFYYVMSLCTKELVFLADQDDIWHEQKLEKMCQIFVDRPEAQVVACKFGLIDGSGDSIYTVMAPSHNGGTGSVQQVTVQDVFYRYEWPGMVMAYRRDWYNGWSGVDYLIPHDLLISAKASEEKVFFQLDEKLAWHRRHDNNTAKEEHRIHKLLDKGRKLNEIKVYTGYLHEFRKYNVLMTTHGQAVLEQKIKTMEEREEALLSGRISKVLKCSWKNRKNVRLATALCDVLIVKKR